MCQALLWALGILQHMTESLHSELMIKIQCQVVTGARSIKQPLGGCEWGMGVPSALPGVCIGAGMRL